ncbi:hypothetical protein CBOM_03693 [Ceraceosorus bombacis]|uniref:Uncharacterized protein n=1 Tax=Ceraceosorus bombacis TaxID=401625 RepID=A0A0P1BGM1_9BASI|nr:hypothetical protein CBOM_03693 [Ceraceosorus bombacis]
MSPADWSGQARLNLPDNYFPNCIFNTTFHAPPQLLQTNSIAPLARYIHVESRKLTVEGARNTLSWMQRQPDKSLIEMKPPFERGMFVITAWHKLACYRDVHFDELLLLPAKEEEEGVVEQGFHHPCLVAPPITPTSLVDGLIYALPAPPPHQDSAVHLCITLSQPVWHHLDRDALFLAFADACA